MATFYNYSDPGGAWSAGGTANDNPMTNSAYTSNDFYNIANPGGSWNEPAPTVAPETQQQTEQRDPVGEYYDWLRSQQETQWAEQQRQEREAASAWLTSTLRNYGLDSLADQVSGLIQQWGTNTDVIALKLKDTSEYKTRFAGLIDLQKRGITDVRNESEYLALETSYRQVFREAGLSSFLGEAGTQNEYGAIADIVSKYSLSVNEVRDRVGDAQRLAASAPQEVKDAFATYYGVGNADIVSFFLDPAATAQRVNSMANAAYVGGVAAAQSLSLGSSVAEQIAGFAGDQDINAAQLTTDMVGARQIRDATSRLAFIDNVGLSDEEVAQSTFDLDAGAKQKVKTLQSRERARFSGSSSTVSGTLSRTSGV